MGFFSKKGPVDPCVICGKDSKASGQTIKKRRIFVQKMFSFIKD